MCVLVVGNLKLDWVRGGNIESMWRQDKQRAAQIELLTCGLRCRVRTGLVCHVDLYGCAGFECSIWHDHLETIVNETSKLAAFEWSQVHRLHLSQRLSKTKLIYKVWAEKRAFTVSGLSQLATLSRASAWKSNFCFFVGGAVLSVCSPACAKADIICAHASMCAYTHGLMIVLSLTHEVSLPSNL